MQAPLAQRRIGLKKVGGAKKLRFYDRNCKFPTELRETVKFPSEEIMDA